MGIAHNNIHRNQLQNQAWYEAFRRALWLKPDRSLAIKVTLVMGLLSIPLVIAGQSFWAVTLSLGVLAGALSETDDHPKGRIKSLSLKVIGFAIASLSVEILKFNPVLLGLGLSISTIGFILIGGTGERYRGITFGAQLVGIYTMIGAEISPAWYLQPVLLTLGSLTYGLFSLLLLYLRPWRLLEEQLAGGFFALSKYTEEKAKLFPSDEALQEVIRTRLALLNVETVAALDRIRDVLNNYRDAVTDEALLKPYLYKFMVLQALHERAASSHERYELLSNDPENRPLLEGIGELLHQLSLATRQYGECLLTQTPYKHPVALDWITTALNEDLIKHQLSKQHPIALLIENLNRSNESLTHIDDENKASYMPRLAQDKRSLWARFKDQLNLNHPRTRFALRLSTAFLFGYTIAEYFNITKGAWIVLTILFVLQQSYSQTRRRLFQRILGTLSGVIFGILTVQFLTPQGQLLFMLASAYFFFLWLKRNYSVSVVFITTFVLCAFNLISHMGVFVMLPRMVDTLIGSTLAIVIVRLMWPDWQSKRLPYLLTDALVKNTAYFKAILNEYRQSAQEDDLEYRIARRAAHRADNALVLAWRDIQVEPKKQQRLQSQAFKLTYLNHALLSYLSAFAAHRRQPLNGDGEIFVFADEILDALDEASQWLGSSNIGKTIHVEGILEEIRRHLLASTQEVTHQQYTMLYNLADITRQLLEQVKSFIAGSQTE